MKHAIIILSAISILVGCNSPTIENKSKLIQHRIESDTIYFGQRQSIIKKNSNEEAQSQIENLKSRRRIKKVTQHNNQNSTSIRSVTFPTLEHYNGMPMLHQENLSQDVYLKHPDTLSKLALYRYEQFIPYFEKAIADNFEDGISNEIIMHPKKLIFKFELFETDQSATPHTTKFITVSRQKNGDLTIE
jgi:hypothetical protein